MLSRLMTRREQLLIAGLIGALCLGALVVYLHGRARAQPPPEAPQETAHEAPAPPEAEYAAESTDDAVPSDPAAPAELEFPQPVAAPIFVSVAGAVAHPGIYELPEGARIKDLVEAAGGAAEGADLSDINQAAYLMDGSTLTVPLAPVAHSAGRTLVLRRPDSAAALNPPEYTISGWQAGYRSRGEAEARAQSSLGGEPAAAAGETDGPIDLNHASADQLEELPGIGPKLAGEIIAFRGQSPFASVDDLTNVSGIGPKKLDAVRPFVTVR